MDIQITRDARLDIIESLAYYGKIGKDQAILFRNTIQNTIDNLGVFPEMYPITYKNYRRALLRTHSHAIYYVIEKNAIIVKAVLPQGYGAKLIKLRLD